jgi:NAD(P)-dependent dehydrogenase (short-subunit alcohol dehydrogenase family)
MWGNLMSHPTFSLNEKVALITGGSKGLGRAIALGYAQAGANIVVASRKGDACEAVAAEVRSLGRKAIGVACHVGRWDQCESLVQRAVDEMGHLDVLVNNAGIAPVPSGVGGVTEALFDKTIEVNLKGPLRLTALAAEHLPEGGSIINISSLASTHPMPHTVVYAAAKAGLNALTRAASLELGPRGIRVNAIVCGSFRTDNFSHSIPTADIEQQVIGSIPLGRIALPDEIVGSALFLASDASAYMTGALLALDGGVG